MPGSLITDEVKALIGMESEPERNRFPISAEMAYDVADAIEDYNPLYVDPDYAERSRFGSLLCPPLAAWKDIAPPIGYFGAGQEWHFEVPLPFNSYGLNGGSDWQFLAPVRVGTWITRRFRILDIFEKQGRFRRAGLHRPRGNPDRPARPGDQPRPAGSASTVPCPAGEQPTDVAQVANDLTTVDVAPPNPEVILLQTGTDARRPTLLRGRVRRRRPAAGGQRPDDHHSPDPLGPPPTANYARIHWGLAVCAAYPGPPERGGQRLAEEPVPGATAAGLRPATRAGSGGSTSSTGAWTSLATP